MRGRSHKRQLAAVAVVAFVCGCLFALAIGPLVRFGLSAVYQDEYGRLVFRCDQAMREHYVAKRRVAALPSQNNADILAAAEVALIDCQDYDILRKRLLRFGLNEEDLSAMGLLAIEERGADIRKIVNTHEIRD